ncbi:class I SAM-dependent methyltransferase [Variovorax sp. VNK109]|jgi:SAM-dependent methyltransferase|uniref:class I SAM-dependent methyltransferase n=1 Tax=Variovorax sp. VNK109 TaxID=3400919 RepID=UPI003BFD8138
MLHDPWLERWMPLLMERAGTGTVLEIGCGHGDDTITLTAAGLRVKAFDLSRASVAIAKLRAPAASIEQRDIRDPFPLAKGQAAAVIASLSLHYFRWQDTLAIVERIRHVLQPGGLVLCRLNSTEDRHFGASGHQEIERNYYSVDGEPKRFFDEDSTRTLFSQGWRVKSLEHFVTRKYVKTKALWEIALEKAE